MSMHNPPHPGEFIEKTYLEGSSFSRREIALKLDVAPSTFNRLIRGDSDISPEMAFRLSVTFGRSPESWLALQAQYDLWVAKKHINLKHVQKIDLRLFNENDLRGH